MMYNYPSSWALTMLINDYITPYLYSKVLAFITNCTIVVDVSYMVPLATIVYLYIPFKDMSQGQVRYMGIFWHKWMCFLNVMVMIKMLTI